MGKNQKENSRKKGIEHTVWKGKTILEETRMQIKKLDSGSSPE
jgi:hypothetical protein